MLFILAFTALVSCGKGSPTSPGGNNFAGSFLPQGPIYPEDKGFDSADFQVLETAANVYDLMTHLDPNKDIWLVDNIDMSATTGFIGIGFGKQFTGHFYGNGKTIKVTIDNIGGGHNNGGFIIRTLHATIENLTISGTVNGFQNAGGIVGLAEGGTKIKNCKNEASILGVNTGGIIGKADNGSGDVLEITGCVNSGALTGTHYSELIGIKTGSGIIKVDGTQINP